MLWRGVAWRGTRFPIRNITRALCRRYIMREVGLELMNEDGSSVLFAFRTNYDVSGTPATTPLTPLPPHHRNCHCRCCCRHHCHCRHTTATATATTPLPPRPRRLRDVHRRRVDTAVTRFHRPRSPLPQRKRVYDTLNRQEAFQSRSQPRLVDMTRRWQRRKISNFEYLMFVNRCVPGRAVPARGVYLRTPRLCGGPRSPIVPALAAAPVDVPCCPYPTPCHPRSLAMATRATVSLTAPSTTLRSTLSSPGSSRTTSRQSWTWPTPTPSETCPSPSAR